MPLFRRNQPAPEEQLIVTARGRDADLELYAHKVRINRHGTTDVPLSSITSVRLSPAGRFSTGSIELLYPGRPDATIFMDQNVISFNRKQQRDFERFRAELDRRLAARYAANER